MKKRNAIFLGVGCAGIVVLVFAVVVMSLAILAPKMFRLGKEQMQAEQARRTIASSWVPPAVEFDAARFFPPQVGAYRLASHDGEASIPEFRFDLDGIRAVYASHDQQVRVHVYQASKLEKEALFRRMEDVWEDHDGGMQRRTNVGYRLYYWSSKHRQNHFWWMSDWLIVFRTDRSEDLEPFIRAYLAATTAGATSPAPSD